MLFRSIVFMKRNIKSKSSKDLNSYHHQTPHLEYELLCNMSSFNIHSDFDLFSRNF